MLWLLVCSLILYIGLDIYKEFSKLDTNGLSWNPKAYNLARCASQMRFAQVWLFSWQLLCDNHYNWDVMLSWIAASYRFTRQFFGFVWSSPISIWKRTYDAKCCLRKTKSASRFGWSKDLGSMPTWTSKFFNWAMPMAMDFFSSIVQYCDYFAICSHLWWCLATPIVKILQRRLCLYATWNIHEFGRKSKVNNLSCERCPSKWHYATWREWCWDHSKNCTPSHLFIYWGDLIASHIGNGA